MSVLDGIKVVEVAIYGLVPSAGAVLSDWGADVVKVEDPETGDPVRNLSSYGFKPGDGGVSVLWEVFNRGKRSIGLNLRKPEGLEILLKLIDEADVFLTNFLPAARKKLGIDADQILARNPRIIYGRGSGQGPDGPDAERGGFDALSYWGRPGVSTAAMGPGMHFPVPMPGPAFGDIQTGLHLANGVIAALYNREKTGKGSVVDVSLLSSGMWAMAASTAGAYVINSNNIVQQDRNTAPNPLGNIYGTSDGRFFWLGFLEPDRYWPDFCRAIGKPELEKDPRFNDFYTRAENNVACIAILDEYFGSLTWTEVEKILRSQEGPWSVVGMPTDAITDEQALANGYIQVVEYSNGARLPLVTPPIQFNKERVELRPGPAHGEHTDEVIGALGLDMDQLIDLKVKGVIL